MLVRLPHGGVALTPAGSSLLAAARAALALDVAKTTERQAQLDAIALRLAELERQIRALP